MAAPAQSRAASRTANPGPTPASVAFRRKSGTRDLVFGLVLAAIGGVLSLGFVSFQGDVVAGLGLVVVGVVYLALGLYKITTLPRASATPSPSRR